MSSVCLCHRESFQSGSNRSISRHALRAATGQLTATRGAELPTARAFSPAAVATHRVTLKPREYALLYHPSWKKHIALNSPQSVRFRLTLAKPGRNKSVMVRFLAYLARKTGPAPRDSGSLGAAMAVPADGEAEPTPGQAHICRPVKRPRPGNSRF